MRDKAWRIGVPDFGGHAPTAGHYSGRMRRDPLTDRAGSIEPCVVIMSCLTNTMIFNAVQRL